MKYAPKAFPPFERLILESEFPGTGTGLANIKRIVERHGGRVWVESAPNQGSSFFFTLG
jgi:signal transduction histidine kinase